jgi:hypothetical protein
MPLLTTSGSTRETCRRSAPFAVDEHHLDDRGHLTQQPQNVETVPLVGSVAPRQLHGPLQLVRDVGEESLDFAGGHSRFGPQPPSQHDALITIAKPGFARSVGQQRHDDRNKQCNEIFLE